MLHAPHIQSRLDLALARWNAGRPDDAAALYNDVLTIDRRNAPALEGLGLIAVARGRRQDAKGLFEDALRIEPNRLTSQASLADILKDDGLFDRAESLARRALARRPDVPALRYLLGDIQWARGDNKAAFKNLTTACAASDVLACRLERSIYDRVIACDWRGYDSERAFLFERWRAGRDSWQTVLPMLLSDLPADIASSARGCASKLYPARPPLWTGQIRRHDRIRIGYLTAEVYDHPVGQLIAGVLEHHDREAFELVAFSIGPTGDDAVRRRIVPCFDEFLQVNEADDAAIAQMMFEREIDIAVTLSGYTLNARPGILAHRPAPVQVNYQGYPGTMGAVYIDYLIADRHVIPAGDEAFYSEKIVWMPDTYQPTDDAAQIAQTPSRAEVGLPDGAFVFMVYNQSCKIAPAMFDVWMRILSRVEDAVLWLASGSEASRDNLRREAAARGVDPARLLFAAYLPERADHVARHRLADLFLDTLPYNAHSTASDALWAGLPVLTCRGTTFPGRVCAGLLSVAGLPDMVMETLADYEELAVALAGDPERLSAIRNRVERDARASPLFDTADYTRHLESAFRTMHETRQAGLAPAAFAVEVQQ